MTTRNKFEPEIRDVSDTAIWVAYYRAQESERPDALFQDPLAKLLTAERGARIVAAFGDTRHRTHWTVVMRTVLIDEFIQRAVADGVDAIVNLGAGLDTRPYRMTLPPTLRWVEADFPHMVEYKNRMLAGHAPNCVLQRVGVDLADHGARRRVLAEVVPDARRVLVLTEGVIPYLKEDQVAALAADLLSQPRFRFWLAEYFTPQVYPYLQAFSRTPMMVNSPFQFFPADWKAFFSAQGWDQQELHFSTEIARRAGRMPPTPLWQRLLMVFMSQQARDSANPRSGFVLMVPRSG